LQFDVSSFSILFGAARAGCSQKKCGNGLFPKGRPRVSPLTDVAYRFTSFRSFAGSPDGLFASAVQLPPAVKTRELLEMLH
jgi:hypothetical protein